MKSVSIQRIDAVLLFGILFVAALYFARAFLVPFMLAVFLAMLMLPVCRKLESWGMHRVAAIFICLFIILLFFAGIVGTISAQAASFSQNASQVQSKLQQVFLSVQQWVQEQFGLSAQRQVEALKQGFSSLSNSLDGFLKSLATGLIGFLTTFILLLVYIFFLLWQRDKYKQFFLQLVQEESRPEAKQTLHQITQVSSLYLGGRLISMLFLAVFNAFGFLMIGLPNAVLLAIIAVIPTIIPYIGPLIGGLFPLVMAFISQSPQMAWGVIGVVWAAQLIDTYVIEPFVFGSNMNLNPFMTIVIIVIGELIWGIAGMILFIPMLAIARIVFDHVPALHPYAYLVGHQGSKSKWVQKAKSWFQKAKEKV